MRVLIYLFLAMTLLCSNGQAAPAMSNSEAVSFFTRFRRLEPPFGARRARRVIGNPQWMRKARIFLIGDLAGSIPLNTGAGRPWFSIVLTDSRGLHSGYSVWLRTTRDISTVEALFRFLAGHADSKAQVLEYSLVHDRLFPEAKIENHDSEIYSK